MLRSFIALSVLAGCLNFSSVEAQSDIHRNDSMILSDMILPFLDKAPNGNPDWHLLEMEIKAKYGETYLDRNLTKAHIYYYFGKNWPVFSKALVHYTESYENKDDLRMMNKNAKMVLQYSQQPEEWKSALGWVKRAVDKEPDNAGYKETYDALSMKIRTQTLKGGN